MQQYGPDPLRKSPFIRVPKTPIIPFLYGGPISPQIHPPTSTPQQYGQQGNTSAPEVPTSTADGSPRAADVGACPPHIFPCGGGPQPVKNKIKCWGRLPLQTTPQYHFIMYIKYIKKKHARNALTLNTLRGAVSSRNTRNVVKKYPKYLDLNGVQMSSRNP